MRREDLERELSRYFDREASKGDLTLARWRALLSVVHGTKQRRRLLGFGATRLGHPRVAAGLAAALLLLFAVTGTSVWLAAPWKGSPAQTTTTGEPAPDAVAPAALYFRVSWGQTGQLIKPGDPVDITLTMTNTWNKPVDVTELPKKATISTIDPSDQAPITIPMQVNGASPVTVRPGETISFSATLPSHLTAGLDPGRYHARFDISYETEPGKPEMGIWTLTHISPVLFVLLPPQGALNKTVSVDQAREANGSTVTLQSIQFSSEKTVVSAFALLPPQVQTTPKVHTAPTVASAPSAGATPTPAPTVTAPSNPSAEYQIDGGGWEAFGGFSYRDSGNGIELQWTLGPVQSDAQTMQIRVNWVDRLAVAASRPQVSGPWTWTVPLNSPGSATSGTK